MGYLSLLKAIQQTGCPRPLTHLKLMLYVGRSGVPYYGLNELCCCVACERVILGRA